MAIAWEPFGAKCLDFIKNSDARLNIAYGAVRSGKTVSCLVRWLDYIVNGPPGDLAMLAKTTATLQRNMLNDLQDIVGPQHFKWLNKQTGELKIYGRRIWLFGANNEDAESKLRGATFAGALCDEVTLYPQSVWIQLLARCSVKGACIFANTNPDNPYHWFYTDFIRNDDIKDKKVWHFTMEDNLSLDAKYVQSLRETYRGVWYDRMVLGLWVAAEGRIYDMIDWDVHATDTRKRLHELKVKHNDPVEKYLVACDYGTSSVMTWSLVAKTVRGTYLKLDEYYYDAVKEKQQKTDALFGDEFERWLKDRPNPIAPAAIYVDPSAASWKAELSYRGFYVQNADNDVINGIRHVATLIAKGQFFIDDLNCPNTIREYSEYVWDRDAQLKGIDKPYKFRDHTPDADRYLLYTDSLHGASGVYKIGKGPAQ